MESFAQLFEESLKDRDNKPGTIVTGTVLNINNGIVTVDAGFKSVGYIPEEQFRDERGGLEVKVGDEVDVVLEQNEDGSGETKLSREKAKRASAWRDLEKAYEENAIVIGMISGKVKGGFTVELKNIRAFLPGSLVDVRPVRDTAYLEGKDLEFKVIKLDRQRNNVVVSRRAVVEAEYSAEKSALLDNLEEGNMLTGVVKNLTDYGAFVDLGGIDGLLHITDMAWKRVKHPSEVVEVGQEIQVKVLKFDREKNRVSLGLKQMGTDPWIDIARRYPVNTRLVGVVTNIADYGCFVEIEEGVEGLVHVTEMDWTNKNVNPAKVVQLGDQQEVMILEIDEDRRRISLGIKQCRANPWDEFAAMHNKGDRIVGTIKSITDFGVFVGLEGNIDGLIHMSDISWNEPNEEGIRKFRKGDEVEAVVLSVDPERERISLGIKQLEKDPFSNFVADNAKGSIVKGVVREVDTKMAIVDLGDGVEGILRAAELAKDRIEDVRSVLKEGEAIEAKFIGFDRRNRMISLSIKAKDADDEASAVEDYHKNAPTTGTATLGDILKSQMNQQNGNN